MVGIKMEMYMLHVSILACAVCLTQGQSTRLDNGCVYTFNVPASDCGQIPSPSVDNQILKSSIIALQAQVSHLVSDIRAVQERSDNLENVNKKLVSDVGNLQTTLATITTDSSPGGAVYIRWGRTTCPGNGSTLVYLGVAAGSFYLHSGGGSNYLCLPRDPEWGPKTTAGFQWGVHLYGAEYRTIPSNDPFSRANARSLDLNDVPCAVCLVPRRPTKLMVPAKLTCPGGWTKEFSGYLMAERYTHKGRTTFVCMDNAPEVIQGGASNKEGVLFYNTEAKCGSLPCPNYIEGWEITCVMCTT